MNLNNYNLMRMRVNRNAIFNSNLHDEVQRPQEIKSAAERPYGSKQHPQTDRKNADKGKRREHFPGDIHQLIDP